MTSSQIKRVYRHFRRRGYAKGEPALQAALNTHARLSGAFAVMEASGWRADPIQLAKNAL